MNRTGWLLLCAVGPAIGALATPRAGAEATDDAAICSGLRSTVAADDRIAACTRVIDSSHWPAGALRWAYLNRCLAQSDKRAWDEALSDCSKAIELDPKYAHAFADRGAVWRGKGDNDRAINDYSEAIRLDPTYAAAFVDRGIAWRAKGDNAKAIADYDEAIRLDPNDHRAFVGRGNVWLVEGQNDKAIVDYDEAIRLDPKYAPAFAARSIVWVRKGDSDRAIADAEEAVRLDPKDPAAFIHRGYAWRAKGDNDKAIADYDEAIRLDPKDALAFLHRGYAWLAKGDNERAIADYGEAIRLDPKAAGVHLARGVAFFANGSFVNAQTDFAEANAIKSNDAFAVLWLDIARRRDRLRSQLAELATKLDMTVWPAPVVRYLLGESDLATLLAAARDSDPEKARGQLCEARFFAGELALINGDKDGAKDLLRSATRDCPKNFVQLPAANAELRALGASP